MEDILIGTVDRTILVFIPDPASTTGQGKTGLVAANLTVSYTRVETDNDVVNTNVTSSLSDLAALTDAHADWGLKEVSATLAPGLYRLDLADAVFAAGAWYAIVQVQITTGLAAATPKAFRLVSLTMDSLDPDSRFRNSVKGITLGTVGVGSTITSIVTSSLDPAATAVDQFKGKIVTFTKDTTTAALRGQSTDITASTTGGVLTVTALTTAPADTDTFTIA